MALGVMPTILARFEAARTAWVSAYLRAIADYRGRFQPGGPEVLLELSPRGGHPVYSFHRIDLASGAVNPPDLREVNLDLIADEEAIHERREDGVLISARPLQWNGVEVSASGGHPSNKVIADWAARWIDAEEVGRPVEPGLLGAIHSITVPEPTADGVTFSVDFGSAPIEAVQELIGSLVSSGATRIEFSSPWGYHT